MLRSGLSGIQSLLCRLFGCKCPKLGTVKWSLDFGFLKVSGEGFWMATTLKDSGDGSSAVGTLAFQTAAGNPGTVDGTPIWQSSDESIVTVAPGPDGMTGTVQAVGPLGMVQIKVTADADLGDGIKPVVLLADIEVVAGEVVGGTINFQIQ